MMKKLFILMVLTFTFVSYSNAQITIEQNPENKIHGNDIEPYCNHLKGMQNRTMTETYNEIPKRPYDVLQYDLFMDWTNPLASTLDHLSSKYTGTNKMTITLTDDVVNILEFDSKLSTIQAVRLNGKAHPFEHFENSVVRLELSETFAKGDELVVEIDYTYEGDGTSGIHVAVQGQYIGVVDYTENDEPKQDSVFIEENIVYTMSEPENARRWMPCNDRPYDKAFSRISILVPEEYAVSSNGTLESADITDGNKLYVWDNKEPITTYLMVANASKFKVWSQWYHKVTNPEDSVEIQNYVWEKDYETEKTLGAAYNSVKTFRNMVRMMEYFSSAFTEYPFVKYGHTVVQPFNFGGMEHQTMTTVNRSWLRRNSDWGLAHELAHQWLGDLITCATWNDIWINEGGATWSEALWSSVSWMPEAYYIIMQGKKAQYINNQSVHTVPIYGIPTNQIFGGNSYYLVYVKSGWVYHMLKETLGDEVFFPALKGIFNKHAYTSITTQDFINTLKELVPNPPVDFDVFFNQWLFKPGHPTYNVVPTITEDGNGKYDIYITVKQVQDILGAAETFVMPLTFNFYVESEVVHTETVMNDKSEMLYYFKLDFEPESILLDETKILCTVVNDISSVIDDRVSELKLFPNPTTDGNPAHLDLTLEKSDIVHVELSDISGNTLLELNDGLLSAGQNRINIETKSLTTGLYLIRIKGKNIDQTVKLSVIK